MPPFRDDCSATGNLILSSEVNWNGLDCMSGQYCPVQCSVPALLTHLYQVENWDQLFFNI